jgi:CMP-N,N'-diacetyllegionaminic acid synthase
MKGYVLAIVPARGNSKGIRKKNIKAFLGEPLIARTIRAAKRARLIDRVVVSTESPEVARVARRYRAEVFERSPALSGDDTPMNWVVDEVVKALHEEGRPIAAIAILYPTAPLRTAADIDGAVALARRLKSYDSVAGICEAGVAPFGGVIERNGKLRYLVNQAQRMYRRQLAPEWFGLNGALWILNPARLGRLNYSLLGRQSYGYLMPRERSVDLDTEFDWKVAECLARSSRGAGTRARRP